MTCASADCELVKARTPTSTAEVGVNAVQIRLQYGERGILTAHVIYVAGFYLKFLPFVINTLERGINGQELCLDQPR